MNFIKDPISQHSWSVTNWQQAALGGGNQDMSVISSKLQEQDADIYSFINQNSQNKEIPEAEKIDNTIRTQSTYEYNQLDSHVQTVNLLSNKISVAMTTKAAIDINSKLLVELAYLSIERLRMSILTNQHESMISHHHLQSMVETNKWLSDSVGGEDEG